MTLGRLMAQDGILNYYERTAAWTVGRVLAHYDSEAFGVAEASDGS